MDFYGLPYIFINTFASTIKLSDKERFDKKQIGVKEYYP